MSGGFSARCWRSSRFRRRCIFRSASFTSAGSPGSTSRAIRRCAPVRCCRTLRAGRGRRAAHRKDARSRGLSGAEPALQICRLRSADRSVAPGIFARTRILFRRAVHPLETYRSLFHIVGDDNDEARGSVTTLPTPVGRLTFVVYGADFHWQDVLAQLSGYLSLANFIAYLPLAAILVVIALVVVRNALKPLRAASAKIVGSISIRSTSVSTPPICRPNWRHSSRP